jgi:RHS repeat-associated protein
VYSIGGDGGRHFYHFDESGNTAFVTDDDGAVVASYAYCPYGRVLNSTGTIWNPFTFQGQAGVLDTGGGVYYARRRFYDSATGNFLSRDPDFSLDPRRLNPYQYALADPRNVADVNGEDPEPSGLLPTAGSIGESAVNRVDKANDVADTLSAANKFYYLGFERSGAEVGEGLNRALFRVGRDSSTVFRADQLDNVIKQVPLDKSLDSPQVGNAVRSLEPFLDSRLSRGIGWFGGKVGRAGSLAGWTIAAKQVYDSNQEIQKGLTEYETTVDSWSEYFDRTFRLLGQEVKAGRMSPTLKRVRAERLAEFVADMQGHAYNSFWAHAVAQSLLAGNEVADTYVGMPWIKDIATWLGDIGIFVIDRPPPSY